jgi:hypothetical protein
MFPPQPLENHMTLNEADEGTAGEATTEEKQAKPLDVMPAAVPTPQAGVFSSAVRITNLYVQGGPSVDVQVAKTGSGGNLTVAPGTSAVVLLSDTITAITALATNSGATSRTPVDIG